MRRLKLLLLLAICLFGSSVKAADEISVRAHVPLSPIYGWTVQRQSLVDLPAELFAGDSLAVSGTLRRTDRVVLINHDVVLLLGQGESVIASAQSRSDSAGNFRMLIAGDQSWRGEMWLSVVVLTYGQPLWLVDRQPISWRAADLSQTPRVVESYVVGQIPMVLEAGNTQVFTGEYHATIKPNANIINDVEKEVGSVASGLVARGRDSPVVDRSFGVCRWTVG